MSKFETKVAEALVALARSVMVPAVPGTGLTTVEVLETVLAPRVAAAILAAAYEPTNEALESALAQLRGEP